MTKILIADDFGNKAFFTGTNLLIKVKRPGEDGLPEELEIKADINALLTFQNLDAGTYKKVNPL
jgi:hypothetical protein